MNPKYVENYNLLIGLINEHLLIRLMINN